MNNKNLPKQTMKFSKSQSSNFLRQESSVWKLKLNFTYYFLIPELNLKF